VGRRSRKARPSEVAPEPAEPREPRLRGEAANEAVRAQLEPLAAGERPRAVTVAVVVAVALAVANVGAYIGGARVEGKSGSLSGVLLFAAILLAAAWGMWNLRYWAVLGFEALLALTVLIAGLSLVVASNVAAVVLCLFITVLGGWLFWKLVGAMARIQMPQRNARQ
jgi:hypothetical protein